MNGNGTATRTVTTAVAGATTLVGATVASGAIALFGAAVVFVGATPTQLSLAVLAGWVPLMALLSTTDPEPGRCWRFVLVFCGSLVGLTLLVGGLVGNPALDATLVGLAGLEFAAAVNPVMSVLVGGAVALAYYGVFEWDDAADGRPA